MGLKRNLTPKEVASLTGVTPAYQRDLRRWGLLDGFGEMTETGRWKYSEVEALGLWIFRDLAGKGWDRDLALDPAMVVAAELFNAEGSGALSGVIEGDTRFPELTHTHIAVLMFAKEGVEQNRILVCRPEELFGDLDVPVSLLISILGVAKSCPGDLLRAVARRYQEMNKDAA